MMEADKCTVVLKVETSTAYLYGTLIRTFMHVKENLCGEDLVFTPMDVVTSSTAGKNIFYKFSFRFPNYVFFPIWILIVLMYYIWETSSNKLKKTFRYQKLFWSFTVRTNCSSDLEIFANSRPSRPSYMKLASASNFKSFSRSLEQFFLTVGQITLLLVLNFPSKVVGLNA